MEVLFDLVDTSCRWSLGRPQARFFAREGSAFVALPTALIMPFRWTTGCVCLLQPEILDGPEENERPGGLVYYGTQERRISNYAPAASMRSSLRSL